MARTITTKSNGIGVGPDDNPLLIAAGAVLSSPDINPGLLAGPISTAWQIDDEGSVSSVGPYGIALLSLGTVSVGLSSSAATASGSIAGIVATVAGSSIVNRGSINGTGLAAVWLQGGGTIQNGTDIANRAQLTGLTSGIYADGTPLVLDNRGTIAAGGGFGAIILAGGSINNGSAADTQASIVGAVDGIADFVGAGTLTNYGTVQGTGAFGGLYIQGATIANAGLMTGLYSGLYVTGGSGSINNTGTITGSGLAGLWLDASGVIANGTDQGTGATISGQSIGLFVTNGTASLDNRGTISAAGAFGAVLVQGGAVNNGSTADRAATITGPVDGLAVFAGTASVSNFGTISGGQAFGVLLATGGTIANAAGGLITGGAVGAELFGAANVTNAGTIATAGGYAAVLAGGGSVANSGLISGGAGGLQLGAPGSVGNSGTISGAVGVQATAPGATLSNAGLIVGTGGTAVSFAATGATLQLQAGAAFTGTVAGNGDSTLELAAAGGTLSGLGTQFTGFGRLLSDAGTSWTLAGAGTIPASGGLSLGGTIRLAAGAILDDEGTLSGAGALDLGGAGTQTLVLGLAADGGRGGTVATSIVDVGAGDAIVLRGLGATAASVQVTSGPPGTSTVVVRDQSGVVLATLPGVAFAGANLTFSASVANGSVTLLAGPPAVVTPGAPTISASLSHDTGVSATDGITTDASVAASIAAPAGLAALTAQLDGGTPSADLAGTVAGGGVALTAAQLAALAGGTVLAGAHVLRLQATDVLGQTGTFALPFTLDGGAKVALTQAAPYATSTGTLSLSGVVSDPNAAVTAVTASLDGAAPVPVQLAAGSGSFTINSATLFGAASATGAHDLKLFTTTSGGATGTLDLPFTVGASTPTVTLSSPANNGTLTGSAVISGVATGGLGSVVGLSYAFDGGTSYPIGFDATTGAFTGALQVSALAAGTHTLSVTALDSAGGRVTVTETETLAAAVPLGISSFTPANLSTQVGVTYRPMVTFSRPVDPATVTSADYFAIDPTGAKVPATIVMGSGGLTASLFFTNPLPAASVITIDVVGSGIKAASDGSLLDAAGSGTAGSTLASTLQTVSVAPIAGTVLTGVIADPGPDLVPGTADDVVNNIDGTKTYKLPIAGATVSVLGTTITATTDATGHFTLVNIPAGDVKIEINGRTATNDPSGYYFPTMTMDTMIRAGVTQTLMGSMGPLAQQQANAALSGVYLPRVQTNVLQAVSNTAPTTVTAPVTSTGTLTALQLSELSLTIQPGSVVDAGGAAMTNAMVGVSPVPSSIVQDMLPPGLLQHTFDITIQSPNAAAFTTPAVLTMPNVFGLAPGQKTYFVSFDHTTGRLEIDGTATVSADGLTVTTDPGQGITKPGWHGMTGPGSNGNGNTGNTSNPNSGLGPAFTNAFDTATNIFGTVTSAVAAVNPPGLAVPFLSALSTASDTASLINDISNGTPGQVLADVGKVSLDLLGFFPPTAVAASAVRAVWGVFDFVNTQAPTVQSQINAAQTAHQGQVSVDNPFGDGAGAGAFGAVDPSLLAAVNADIQTITKEAPLQIPIYQQIEADYKVIGPLSTIYDSTKPNGGLTADQSAALNAAAADLAAQAKKLDGHPNLLATIQHLTTDTSAYLNALQGSLIVARDLGYLKFPELRSAAADSPTVGAGGGTGATTGSTASTAAPSAVGATLYGAFKAPDGSVQRLSFASAGTFQYFLAASTTYEFTAFDPTTGSIGSTLFTSSASGAATTIPTVLLAPDNGAAGLDGLTKTQAYVIGVNNAVASNLVPGITDLAALKGGLYNGSVLPSTTGIVAAAALKGSAQAVVLANSIVNTQASYAFVATGSYGLAVVDVSTPFSPLVLSQTQLAGNSTAVAVDIGLGVAVVASGGGGVHFIDLSSLTAPRVFATVAITAAAIVESAGVAYAASGTSIVSLDVASGTIIQTFAAKGSLTGLAIRGTTLYAMNTSDLLQTFDLSSGAIVAQGSAQLPGGGNGLVVSNGVAYVAAAAGSASGGYLTVDVSDPAAPKLIEKADLANLAGRALAVNGSGIALGVQQIQVNQQGLTNVADLINVANPANTSGFQTRFNLPDAPGGVAIGNGIGFVADGASGLQVLNYLPPDTSGTPPTITLVAPPVDVDPATAGTQVYAGEAISLGVAVADNVQVRDVQLLVNGTVVADAASAPFDLGTVLPTLAANGGFTTVTVQAQAIDTGGNTAITPAITLSLVPDLRPLGLLGQSIVEGGIVSTALRSIDFTFSKPVNPATLAPADFDVIGPGGTVVAPSALSFLANNKHVTAVYPTLAAGSYTLDVVASKVLDVAGIALGTADLLTHFSVQTFTEQFTNAAGGDWNTPSNWNTGTVPQAIDTVYLGLAGAPVTFGGGSATVASLVGSPSTTLAISGGAISVTGTTSLPGTTSLSFFPLIAQAGAVFGQLSVANTSVTVTGTLTDLGSIALNAYTGTQLVAAGTLTLAGGGVVAMSDSANNAIASNGTAALLVNAADTISGGGTVGDALLSLVNAAAGTIDATTGSVQLTVAAASVANAGLLETTGGAGLRLAGTTIANTGTILAAGAGTHVDLATAIIAGGVLATSGGGVIQAADSGSVLANVTLSAGSQFALASVAATLKGQLTNLGTVQLNAYLLSTLVESGTVTLAGGGLVAMSDTANNRISSDNTIGATLINVDNTISGAGQIGDGTLGLTNLAAGVIDATLSNSLSFYQIAVANSGLIEATGTAARLGGLRIDTATIDNRPGNGAGVILANGAGAHVDLASATILGGTLKTSNGGVIQAVDSGSVLADVTLSAGSQFALASVAATLKGQLTNLGTVQLNAYLLSTLVESGTVTLAGGGLVAMSDTANNRISSDNTIGATLINVDNTISGAGQIGDGTLGLTNLAAGVIDATLSTSLKFYQIAVANSGLIEATGTAASLGGLRIDTATIDNRPGNGAGVILANGAGAHVDLASATILGGTLKTSNGGVIQAVDSGSTIDAATIAAGSVFVLASQTITMSNVVDNGTIDLNAYLATQISVAGTLTLRNAGVVAMNDSANNRVASNGAAATLLNVDQTITGAGTIGDAFLGVVNQASGTIDATASSQLVLTGAVANAGLLEGTGPGALVLRGSVANTGTIGAFGTTANVYLQSGTITGGVLTTGNGGQIGAIDAGSVLSGVTIAAGAQVHVHSGDALALTGTVVNAGTITTDTYFATQIRAAGVLNLGGSGSVNLGGSTNSQVVSNGTAATLNLSQTISGAGRIGDGLLTVVNTASGTIDGAGLTLSTGTLALTNAGLLRSGSASALTIQGMMVTNTGTIGAFGIGALVALQTAIIEGGTLASAGGGQIAAIDQGSVLSGVTVAAGTEVHVRSGQALTMTGTIANAGTFVTDTYFATQYVAAGTLTLTGSGSVILADIGNTNSQFVGAGAALLNNAQTIAGSGLLGDGTMTIANFAAGQIVASSVTPLRVSSAGTLANAGLLEATGTGGLLLAGAVANTGTLWANGANVVIGGAVSGSGAGRVTGGGTLELGGAVSAGQTVTLDATATGALRLDQSTAFAGSVSGLALDGTNRLDLSDIAYVTATQRSFSGTAAGGTLRVTDGTNTATITLIGNYVGRVFVLASDGHGGTLVRDPDMASLMADLTGFAGAGGGATDGSGAGAATLPAGSASAADLGLAAAASMVPLADPAHRTAM